ncbi:MAG: RIP metalloprotease RseP [Acidobacteriota bacterium]
MLDFLQSFWWFLVLIGVMILLHEMGHYLVARLFDVHIEAFSFGFGPRLFGFKRGETDFKFCAFLLGGYVKMAGEQPGEIAGPDVQTMDPRAFPAKPRWQRLCIIFAGPAVNMVLAVAILTGLFMFEYQRVPNPPNPVVGYVAPDGSAAKVGIQEGDKIIEFDGKVAPTWEDIQVKELVGVSRDIPVIVEREGQRLNFTVTPAAGSEQRPGGSSGWSPQMDVQVAGSCCGVDIEKAGLKSGDTFVSLNGQPVRSAGRLIDIVGKSGGSPIQIVFRRAGQLHETTITPSWSKDDGTGRWRLGAALQSPVEITQLSFRDAFNESMRQNKQNALLLYKFLQSVVEQRMSPKSIDGPIGIAVLSGRAAKEGVVSFLGLMAMVSLNLAVVNLLPIPLLDGGGILMLLIEMLMQRDLSMRVKEGIVKVGFAFLMVVIVFVIFNDISKILPGG